MTQPESTRSTAFTPRIYLEHPDQNQFSKVVFQTGPTGLSHLASTIPQRNTLDHGVVIWVKSWGNLNVLWTCQGTMFHSLLSRVTDTFYNVCLIKLLFLYPLLYFMSYKLFLILIWNYGIFSNSLDYINKYYISHSWDILLPFFSKINMNWD